MAILDLLKTSVFGLKGDTPARKAGASKTSTLHFQSSINNNPKIEQSPSKLDLDGKTPSGYIDNLPK